MSPKKGVEILKGCFFSVSVPFFSFRFVSFRFVSFRFVSFRFVSFRFVSFRFVSFRPPPTPPPFLRSLKVSPRGGGRVLDARQPGEPRQGWQGAGGHRAATGGRRQEEKVQRSITLFFFFFFLCRTKFSFCCCFFLCLRSVVLYYVFGFAHQAVCVLLVAFGVNVLLWSCFVFWNDNSSGKIVAHQTPASCRHSAVHALLVYYPPCPYL